MSIPQPPRHCSVCEEEIPADEATLFQGNFRCKAHDPDAIGPSQRAEAHSDAAWASASEHVYIGFWRRFWASIIDSLLIVMLTWPFLIAVYGWEYFAAQRLIYGTFDFLMSWVLPAVAVILFWVYKSATPGKMAISAKIVDARTGGKPSVAQFVGRYFAYFLSLLPLGLGILWVAFDSRKQGWHDKLAGTIVVHSVVGHFES